MSYEDDGVVAGGFRENGFCALDTIKYGFGQHIDLGQEFQNDLKSISKRKRVDAVCLQSG